MRTLFVACLLAFSLATGAQASPFPFLDSLVQDADLSAHDIQKLDDDPAVHELDVEDSSRNAAFLGIIRIETDGAGLGEALETLDLAAVTEADDAFGRFHDPARPTDVEGIQFSDDDLEVLSECGVGECKFKLGKEEIDRLAQIDWNDPNAGKTLTHLFHETLLAYVDDYRKRGDDALVVYADKSAPVSIAKTLKALLAEETTFAETAPRMSAYVTNFPDDARDSVSESITWSVESFGYRPTITVDQMFVDHQPEMEGALSTVAVKTLYANHYLEGRVQLGVVVDGQRAFGVPGHFIVISDSIRFDDRLGGFKRSLLARGLRSDVEDRMRLLRGLADAKKNEKQKNEKK